VTNPARILVVDDDSGIRTMLQLALSSRGYQVDCVADHHDTWVGKPDLVLLDVRLGAYTAAEFLAGADLDEGTSVVIMTAGDDVRRVAAELDVAAAISKPFDLDELFEVVELHCTARADAAVS
jgi:DNA-binding response OmpR family regulator